MKRLLELYRDDYFDPKGYLQSGDAEYRDNKVQKHFPIVSWAYLERKDDSVLREAMLLLLENGCGIEDYSSVIRALSFHKAEVEASGAYRRQAERWKGAKRSFERQEIADANLIESIGEGKVETGWGDYLLMEEDWLEEEFGGGAGRVSGNGRKDDGGAVSGLARADADVGGATKERAQSRRASIYAGNAVQSLSHYSTATGLVFLC